MQIIARKRFAVMFTDIVGFSALMEKSESKALAALEKQRLVLAGSIARNEGRLIKEIGDGTLSIFSSPSAAVRSARILQNSLRSENFQLRIGIHWGEVLVGGEDVLGDTVNVASRLEEISAPGGICVSGELLSCYQGRKPASESLGVRRLKGLGRLIEVFAIRGDSRIPLPVASDVPAEVMKFVDPGDGAPSILISLLENLGDETDAFYSFGITADLITDLTRAGSIAVAPMTTMMQQVKSTGSPEAAAARLGSAFLLKGSLWRTAGVFRLSVELHDTTRSRLIWLDNWQEDWIELPSIKGKLADGILKALGVSPGAFPGMTGAASSSPTPYELYLKGRHLWRTKKSREDTTKVRHLMKEALEGDPGLINARVILGETYREGGEFEKGIAIFEEALAKAQETGDIPGALRCENAIGISKWHTSDLGEARAAFVRVARTARRIGDREGEAKALNNLGLVDCALARYDRSLRNLERSRTIAVGLGATAHIANTLCNIGLVHWKKGGDKDALRFYEDSLELLQSLDDLVGQSNLLRNMGIAYNRMGFPEKAMEMAGRSLSIAVETYDRMGECRSLNNLGNSLLEIGRREEAADCYRKALAISVELGLKDLEGLILTNISVLLTDPSEAASALSNLEKALEITRQIGDEEGETEILGLIGFPLIELGREEDALSYLREAMELSRKIGVTSFRAQTRLCMLRILARKGGPGYDRENALAQLAMTEKEIRGSGRARARMLWKMALHCFSLASTAADVDEESRLVGKASGFLLRARQDLLESASRFRDEVNRRSFLENIPDHVAILEAYRIMHGNRDGSKGLLVSLTSFINR